jgi:hypothetical protein
VLLEFYRELGIPKYQDAPITTRKVLQAEYDRPETYFEFVRDRGLLYKQDFFMKKENGGWDSSDEEEENDRYLARTPSHDVSPEES